MAISMFTSICITFVVHGIWLIALFTRPSPYRWRFFIPICGITLLRILWFRTNNRFHEFFTAQQLGLNLIQVSEHVLITDVQKELRMKGQNQPAYNLAPLPRLKWAFTLMYNPRGIGWTHEIAAVLPQGPQGMTRLQFISRQVIRLLWCLLIVDITRMHDFWNPYSLQPSLFASVLQWLWPYWIMWSWGIFHFAGQNLNHIVVSIFALALRLSDPEAWPPMFGSFKDAYTLGRFWGLTWHQNFRIPFTNHGKFLSQKVLHLDPRSPSRHALQVAVAFLLSGLGHLPGGYSPDHSLDPGLFILFALHGVAVLAETVVLRWAYPIYDRGDLKSSKSFTGTPSLKWRLVGYVWVCGYFTFTGFYWMRPAAAYGIGKDAVHLSPLLGVLKGRWFVNPSG